MFTYRVDTPDDHYVLVEADFFEMRYDGHNSVDAYFFVRKPVEKPVITTSAQAWEAVQVAFVSKPKAIYFDEKWMPRPRNLDGSHSGL